MKPSYPQAVQVIEQTDKAYKAWMVIGGGICLVGALMFTLATLTDTKLMGYYAMWVGGVTWLISKVLAWWNHA